MAGLQQPVIAGGGSAPPSGASSGGTPVSILKTSSGGVGGQEVRKKVLPPLESRMVVYVRQENEEIYTPLHLVPPTVPGLARAIESKYNVSATAIRSTSQRSELTQHRISYLVGTCIEETRRASQPNSMMIF